MQLSTTTADFRGYGRTVAEEILLFEQTPFRLLDLNLYRIIYPGSPYLADDDSWKTEIEAIGRAAERIGARFVQAHSPDGEHFQAGPSRDALMLATKRSIEACAMLGIPQTVVHAAGRKEFTHDQFRQANRAFYEELLPVAERCSVCLLTENSSEQNSPYYYLRTGAELRDFVDYVGHPLLRVCWDTGHANMRKMDQYPCLLDIGDYLSGLHVQDNMGDSDLHTAPYSGSCNFDPVLQGLIDVGYRGTFNFECTHLLRQADSWPVRRQPWEYRRQPVQNVIDLPLDLRCKAVDLVYAIGRHMLSSYGVFEE